MSTLAYIRDAATGTLDYEGQVFGYSFDLMEQVKEEVGQPNPMIYAVDEDELIDDDELDEIIEAAEENGEDSEDAEDRAYNQRGEFFDKSLVLASLSAYHAHFAAHPELRAGKAIGEYLAADLKEMIRVIEAAQDQIRLYLA